MTRTKASKYFAENTAFLQIVGLSSTNRITQTKTNLKSANNYGGFPASYTRIEDSLENLLIMEVMATKSKHQVDSQAFLNCDVPVLISYSDIRTWQWIQQDIYNYIYSITYIKYINLLVWVNINGRQRHLKLSTSHQLALYEAAIGYLFIFIYAQKPYQLLKQQQNHNTLML